MKRMEIFHFGEPGDWTQDDISIGVTENHPDELYVDIDAGRFGMYLPRKDVERLKNALEMWLRDTE